MNLNNTQLKFEISICFKGKMKADKNLNHSTAHVLAAAVLRLYPNVKLAIGPPTEEGFYYDFDFQEKKIESNDLQKIEKIMQKIIISNAEIKKVPAVELKNCYKQELIKELKEKNEVITYYGLIDPISQSSLFTDLCKGGHIKNISEIKHFKLLSLAGAYWRGNSNNKQLTRIYGTAWKTEKELNDFLNLLKERKERDHRKLGHEMNIFMFHKDAGQGFPIWLQDGVYIKNKIQNYIRKIEYSYGFREVETPVFGSKNLYIQSGHWDHYQEYMFPTLKFEHENLILRPMTCPHHILIFSKEKHSYRDLPIRMSEHSQLYRYEPSGSLSGLERVRSMVLTDAHIFARENQIKEEFTNSYKLIDETLSKFNIKIDHIALSLHNPNDKDKYYKNDKMWKYAEQKLRDVLKELNVTYKEFKGEAAFYGPKVDVQVKTALGHEITISTLQLDFMLPEKFNLAYIDNAGNYQRPVIIHRGLIGTYERFIAILLEQTKGILPFWLAPNQIIIIPVSTEKHYQYAKQVFKYLEKNNLQVKIDNRNERLAKKIREAQISKTKFQIVIGDKEINNKTISVRSYGSQEQKTLSVLDFIKQLKNS